MSLLGSPLWRPFYMLHFDSLCILTLSLFLRLVRSQTAAAAIQTTHRGLSLLGRAYQDYRLNVSSLCHSWQSWAPHDDHHPLLLRRQDGLFIAPAPILSLTFSFALFASFHSVSSALLSAASGVVT